MISFTDAKKLLSKFTVTGAQKAHIDRLVFELGVMEKEFASLREQIAEKDVTISDIRKQIADLTAKLEAANQKLEDHSPQLEGFDKTTKQIVLLMFHDSDELSMEWIADQLRLELGIVRYHFDLLMNENMVDQTRLAMGSGSGAWQLSRPGRAYAMKLKTSEQEVGGEAL